MKTYEYSHWEVLIPPGVYSILHRPHFNADRSRSTLSGVVMKINKPTSVALLGRWLAKQYSTEWILPQIDCQVVDILQLTRIDQQKEVETERKRLIKEHTSS